MAVPVTRARRSWPRRIAFAALGAVLVLAVLATALELAARWCWQLPPQMAHLQQSGMFDDDPAAGFGLLPGYRGTLQIQASSRSTAVAIDALGMRSEDGRAPDLTVPAARVLVIGDSLIFGYGVECNEALPAQLERRLQQGSAQSVQVGNGGAPGHCSRDEVLHLRALLTRFPADVVVFAVYPGNDFREDRQPDRAIYGGLFHDGPWARLFQRSARARLAMQSRACMWLECWLIQNRPQSSLLPQLAPTPEDLNAFAGWPVSPPDFQRTHAGLFLDVRDDQTTWQAGAPPVLPGALATLRESLTAAKALAGARPLLVLLLPTWWHCSPEAWRSKLAEMQFDPQQFEFGLLRRRIADVARGLDLPIVDATDVLQGPGDTARFFIEDHGHLSVEGNARVADQLAPLVRERLPRR